MAKALPILVGTILKAITLQGKGGMILRVVLNSAGSQSHIGLLAQGIVGGKEEMIVLVQNLLFIVLGNLGRGRLHDVGEDGADDNAHGVLGLEAASQINAVGTVPKERNKVRIDDSYAQKLRGSLLETSGSLLFSGLTNSQLSFGLLLNTQEGEMASPGFLKGKVQVRGRFGARVDHRKERVLSGKLRTEVDVPLH